MTLIKYVSPEAPAPESSHAAATPSLGSSGIRLGILDNSKGNADYLLSLLADGVRTQLTVTSVVSRHKLSASRAAEVSMLDELAREADFVVSAMAD